VSEVLLSFGVIASDSAVNASSGQYERGL